MQTDLYRLKGYCFGHVDICFPFLPLGWTTLRILFPCPMLTAFLRPGLSAVGIFATTTGSRDSKNAAAEVIQTVEITTQYEPLFFKKEFWRYLPSICNILRLSLTQRNSQASRDWGLSLTISPAILAMFGCDRRVARYMVWTMGHINSNEPHLFLNESFNHSKEK